MKFLVCKIRKEVLEKLTLTRHYEGHRKTANNVSIEILEMVGRT